MVLAIFKIVQIQLIFIGSRFVGGIIGASQGNTIIQNCTNTKTNNSISGKEFIGGVVGINMGSTIRKCKNEGNIEGNDIVGGIVGANVSTSEENNINITECGNTGTITSNSSRTTSYYVNGKKTTGNSSDTGGIAGYACKTIISECSNNGTVNTTNTSTGNCLGGIVGEIRNGEITSCYNGTNGTITSNTTSGSAGSYGGIAGNGIYNVNINNCYNKGSIKGYTSIGGIIGIGVDTNIRYCYNTGDITGNTKVAGIISYIRPFASATHGNNYIYYCYNRGTVTGSTEAGSINANASYADIDYTYALEGTCSKLFVTVTKGSIINATHQGLQDKATLTSTVLSFPENKFRSDYTGNASVNEGFPILSWQ